jgi:hypothetical protein
VGLYAKQTNIALQVPLETTSIILENHLTLFLELSQKHLTLFPKILLTFKIKLKTNKKNKIQKIQKNKLQFLLLFATCIQFK